MRKVVENATPVDSVSVERGHSKDPWLRTDDEGFEGTCARKAQVSFFSGWIEVCSLFKWRWQSAFDLVIQAQT
jgi:hypothetical protein